MEEKRDSDKSLQSFSSHFIGFRSLSSSYLSNMIIFWLRSLPLDYIYGIESSMVNSMKLSKAAILGTGNAERNGSIYSPERELFSGRNNGLSFPEQTGRTLSSRRGRN